MKASFLTLCFYETLFAFPLVRMFLTFALDIEFFGFYKGEMRIRSQKHNKGTIHAVTMAPQINGSYQYEQVKVSKCIFTCK